MPAAETEGNRTDDLILALKIENRKNSYSCREKANILSYLCPSGVNRNAEAHVKELPEIKEIENLVQDSGSFVPSAAAFSALCGTLAEAVNSGRIDLKTASQSGLRQEAAAVLLDSKLTVSELRQAFRQIYELSVYSSMTEEDEADLARIAIEKGIDRL